MFCKKCRYDLRNLPIPRCPECGTEFDPRDPCTFDSVTKPRRISLEPLLVISAFSPLLMMMVVLGVWFIGCIVFGRVPWPHFDDPKFAHPFLSLVHSISSVVLLSAAFLSLLFWPLLFVYVAFEKDAKALKVLILGVAWLITFVGAEYVRTSAIASAILNWYFD